MKVRACYIFALGYSKYCNWVVVVKRERNFIDKGNKMPQERMNTYKIEKAIFFHDKERRNVFGDLLLAKVAVGVECGGSDVKVHASYQIHTYIHTYLLQLPGRLVGWQIELAYGLDPIWVDVCMYVCM